MQHSQVLVVLLTSLSTPLVRASEHLIAAELPKPAEPKPPGRRRPRPVCRSSRRNPARRPRCSADSWMRPGLTGHREQRLVVCLICLNHSQSIYIYIYFFLRLHPLSLSLKQSLWPPNLWIMTISHFNLNPVILSSLRL